jgi:uncharacterized protein
MQDIHVHVWDPALHFAPALIQETEIARGRPIDLAVDFDQLMDDMSVVDRAVVFGMKARRTGYWVPDEYVADFVQRAGGKLVGFAACDPTQTGYMEALKYAIEGLHLSGVKMGPTYAGFDPRDRVCEPVYQYCQSRGLPILFHVGTTYNRLAPLGFSRPWLWDEVAMNYPDLRMVLAHVGHPFSDECLAVIRKHPHVYADIAALFYRPWQFYNTMILAQEYHVAHKLLFGTDYPFTTMAESLESIRDANHVIGNATLPRISEQVIEELFERDSLRLLGIEA